ncbi:MAG TPA: hypothetical protein VFC19_07865 [Candidatus Limnocylindrales bacterium]|nr:hypothetical protein [Candidatus Limnocylindrales bacterium]
MAAAQEAVRQIRQAGGAGCHVLLQLAVHLINVQRCLSEVGRFEEALAAAQEAVSVEAQIQLADPTVDPSGLADALENLASCFVISISPRRRSVPPGRPPRFVGKWRPTGQPTLGTAWPMSWTVLRITQRKQMSGLRLWLPLVRKSQCAGNFP